MAIVSAGYDGTVDETQFAKLLNRYSVVGPNDFDATNVAGDRLITISGSTAEPSQALGPGLYDSAADLGTFQFAAATGTRWDLVVLRRDWQPPGGNTSVQIIQGGASKALPGRETNPGVVDDQPLYLQQINGNLLGERVDLRCWAGPGGVEAADLLALSYLASPGAAVKVGGTVWRYELQANGVWGWSDGNAGWESLALGSTPGVAGVRGAGVWVPTSGSVAPSVRLRAGGDIIHVRGEVKYVNSTTPGYLPDEGWVVATIPAGMRPSEMTFITGTSDTYRKSQVFTVYPDGSIRLGPNPTGLVYQFNGIVPN